MSQHANLETDYLVVGAGANGMAFVDTLIQHSDADVVMIDRRHRAGGHWLDAYPFVQLHQASAFYGVGSTPLGQDRLERDGDEAGFAERASGSEISGYYDEVLRHRLLASGRVRFFPMSEYFGDRRFRSRLTDQLTDVTVHRAVVDATYMASRVPGTDPPPFAVADGVRCVPVGELTAVDEPPGGYDIIGGGKTALDAICWLLDQGTSPDSIRWVRPRDSWVLNRAFFQPGAGALPTFEGVVLTVEAVAESDSVEEIYERLEAAGLMLRTDTTVQPGMMRGATLSLGELEQLRRVSNIVRMGHVERIDVDEIVLEQGSIPTGADRLHVHCASAGLSDKPPKPIFSDDTITLQGVTRVSISLSGALLGYVESTPRTTQEKNTLCPPNPWPHTPFDYLRAILVGMRTEVGWLEAADVQAFVDASRLNLIHSLPDQDPATVSELQNRFLGALFPALTKLDQLAERASPAEQARMQAAA
ncbi:MAG: NAD(P)-binding protein [Iamia sp.]